MPLILTQTGSASTFNVGCSGRSGSLGTRARELESGGTPGTNLEQISLGSSQTNVASIDFRTVGGVGVASWGAGDYVVRLNVNSTTAAHTWTETYICERTSGGVFNTVASLTGQTTVISAGVKTHTVNRATDYTPAGTDSDLFIVLVFTNPLASFQSFTFYPNQDVDTPIVVPSDVSAWDEEPKAQLKTLDGITAANLKTINGVAFQ